MPCVPSSISCSAVVGPSARAARGSAALTASDPMGPSTSPARASLVWQAIGASCSAACACTSMPTTRSSDGSLQWMRRTATVERSYRHYAPAHVRVGNPAHPASPHPRITHGVAFSERSHVDMAPRRPTYLTCPAVGFSGGGYSIPPCPRTCPRRPRNQPGGDTEKCLAPARCLTVQQDRVPLLRHLWGGSRRERTAAVCRHVTFVRDV